MPRKTRTRPTRINRTRRNRTRSNRTRRNRTRRNLHKNMRIKKNIKTNKFRNKRIVKTKIKRIKGGAVPPPVVVGDVRAHPYSIMNPEHPGVEDAVRFRDPDHGPTQPNFILRSTPGLEKKFGLVPGMGWAGLPYRHPFNGDGDRDPVSPVYKYDENEANQREFLSVRDWGGGELTNKSLIDLINKAKNKVSSTLYSFVMEQDQAIDALDLGEDGEEQLKKHIKVALIELIIDDYMLRDEMTYTIPNRVQMKDYSKLPDAYIEVYPDTKPGKHYPTDAFFGYDRWHHMNRKH